MKLVPDLITTDAFIRALRRFIGRRGTPSLIVSDNAKNFTSACRVLSALFKNMEVQGVLNWKKIILLFDKRTAYMVQINKKFIPQKSPSDGGFNERMV